MYVVYYYAAQEFRFSLTHVPLLYLHAAVKMYSLSPCNRSSSVNLKLCIEHLVTFTSGGDPAYVKRN